MEFAIIQQFSRCNILKKVFRVEDKSLRSGPFLKDGAGFAVPATI